MKKIKEKQFKKFKKIQNNVDHDIETDAHSEYIIELIDIDEAIDYFLLGYSKI